MSSPLQDGSIATNDVIEAVHINQLFPILADLEDGKAFFRPDLGSANAYQVDFSGTPSNKNQFSAYHQGMLVIFKAANTNTGASTLQVVGPSGNLTALPLTKSGSVALEADDIQAGQMVAAVCNDLGGGNFRFEMVGAPAVNLTAGDIPSGVDASKIGSGSVSNTEFGYLDGVTGGLQAQIDGKAASSHTHPASDIASGQVALAHGGTGSDLSATGGAGQVLKQTSAGGAVSVSALTASDMPSNIDASKIGSGSVSNAEFGYLDGVTSGLQAQIDDKEPSITTLPVSKGGLGQDASSASGFPKFASGSVSIGNLIPGDLPNGIDAIKIGTGSVSNTEFGYLDGVTGGLQAQIDGKAASSHTHPASDLASGQVALARGGTGSDLSATGGAGQVLKQTSAGGAVSVSALTASDMPNNIDASKIGSGSVSNAEFGYLDGVTSGLQAQIDGKAASSHTHPASDLASGQVALARGGTGSDLSATGGAGQVLKQTSAGGAVSVSALTASDMPNNIDASKIGSGSVSNAEFGYLDGVTSGLQAQIDGKAASSHTHPASDIASGQVALARGGTGSDLSATGGAGQVLKQTSAGGAVSVSALTASDMPNNIDASKIGSGSVSNAEFGYLDGVTSGLQAQIDGKAASSHTHPASDLASGQVALARGGTGSDLSATGGAGQVLKQTSAGGAVSVSALTASDMPNNIDASKIGSGSVSNAEFGYLDGVTGGLQAQIDGKEPSITTLPVSKGGLGQDASTASGLPKFASGVVTIGGIDASDLTSGVLPENRGGTGQSSYTKGDLLVSDGSGLNKLAVGANNSLLVADSSQGEGVKWSALQPLIVPSSLYGDGSDGDVTISSGTTTLTRPMYYNNLTVAAGAVLNANGCEVRVRGTLSNSGTIRSNGGNASGSTGGAQGSGLSRCLGGAGQNGAVTQSSGTSAPRRGPELYSSSGGNGGGQGPKSGGSGTNSNIVIDSTNAVPIYKSSQSIYSALSSDAPGLVTTNVYVPRQLVGGNAGGSGGNNVSGGAGGGSGAGGDFLRLFARNLSGNGTIQANGGNGGNAVTNGGGGGGGGGGVVLLVSESTSHSFTLQANGGSGGSGAGGGAAGSAGGNGYTVFVGGVQ